MTTSQAKTILFAVFAAALLVLAGIADSESYTHNEPDAQSDIASAIEAKIESHGADLNEIKDEIDRIKEEIADAKESGDVEKEAASLMDL